MNNLQNYKCDKNMKIMYICGRSYIQYTAAKLADKMTYNIICIGTHL